MIAACDICDRQNVPVANFHPTALYPETSACFLCQGEDDPDPYGELEALKPASASADKPVLSATSEGA